MYDITERVTMTLQSLTLQSVASSGATRFCVVRATYKLASPNPYAPSRVWVGREIGKEIGLR